MIGGRLSDPDQDRLHRLADHAARGILSNGDLEPHLGGPAHPSARGLNRKMKCQSTGRMANRENRRLARREVVAQAETGGGTRLPAARRHSGGQKDFLGNPRLIGQKLRRQTRQVGGISRGPTGHAGTSDRPPRRIELDGHVLLRSTRMSFSSVEPATAGATIGARYSGASARARV